MTETRLVKLAWVAMGFLVIGFVAGAKGWANTLEAVKADIPLPALEASDEIRLEQFRANRRPGFMDGEPRYVDARFDTREEAAARIAAPVLDSESSLDPLPPEGSEERLDSQI